MSNSYNNVKTPEERMKEINTYGPSFYNEAEMLRMDINFWNKRCIIQIADTKKSSNGTGFEVDDKNMMKLIITPSTVAAIYEAAEDALSQVKEFGKIKESIAITCGVEQTSVVQFSNGSEIDQPEGIYFIIYKNLNEKKIPETIKFFKFTNSFVLKNYDHKTGSYKKDDRKENELKSFIKVLDSYVVSASMAMAHSVREATKFEKISNFTTLNTIASALGVNILSGAKGNKSGKRSDVKFEDTDTGFDNGGSYSEVSVDLDGFDGMDLS